MIIADAGRNLRTDNHQFFLLDDSVCTRLPRCFLEYIHMKRQWNRRLFDCYEQSHFIQIIHIPDETFVVVNAIGINTTETCNLFMI